MREGLALADVLDEESHGADDDAPVSTVDEEVAAGDGPSDRTHLA